MSVIRYRIDLAAPNPLPPVLFTKPTAAELTWMSNHTWLEIIRAAIVKLKGLSNKIKPGTIWEEDTLKSKYHICHHDETPPIPCEPEEDI